MGCRSPPSNPRRTPIRRRNACALELFSLVAAAVASFDASHFSYSFFTLVLRRCCCCHFFCCYSLAHAIRADAHTLLSDILWESLGQCRRCWLGRSWIREKFVFCRRLVWSFGGRYRYLLWVFSFTHFFGTFLAENAFWRYQIWLIWLPENLRLANDTSKLQ